MVDPQHEVQIRVASTLQVQKSHKIIIMQRKRQEEREESEYEYRKSGNFRIVVADGSYIVQILTLSKRTWYSWHRFNEKFTT